MLDWLLRERLQLEYRITGDKQEAAALPFCIAYGARLPNSISIPAAGLLVDGARVAAVETNGTWRNLPVLFSEAKDGYSLNFDLLSAVFYLLSRYEEYQPFTPDKHRRYPATESILYKRGWLDRPLIDEWVYALRCLLGDEGVLVPVPAFTFIPTYDIDMAYSHVYKGIGRIAGAYLKALLKGDVYQITERTQVLKKKKKDPYDSFLWLRHLHEQYHYKPLYFVLSALKTTAYDKNIHPRHPAMIRVIKQLAKEGETGIHPSYYANKAALIRKEKAVLEEVSGRGVHISRQHYIRLQLPETYHLLMDNGITDDYSMGYGGHLGFRAGTGSSFSWYDLNNDKVTSLRVHPFCFMDTTAHYEQGLSPEDAFTKLNKMAEVLRSTGSTLIPVFHNFSLGAAQEWHGWSEAYAGFLAGMNK